MKKLLNRIFAEGLSGMVLGIYSTLILGTIVWQIGYLLEGQLGDLFVLLGTILVGITGAGIGCGIALKLKESTLVVLSAAVAGMAGALSDKLLAGESINFHSSMNLLTAFVAAYVATEVGHLLAGKTKLDLIVVPIPSIVLGTVSGLFIAPFYNKAMQYVVQFIQWGLDQNPIIMGAVIATVMGMLSIMPIHMAALGIILGLTGKAAGAATIGCCASMVGFAVASYKENGLGGFVAQSMGSGILQFPNIIRKPIIWLPTILTSAILGAVGTLRWFQMVNTKRGAVMGSSGLIGQITTYQTMIHSHERIELLIKIGLLHFVMPALLSYVITQFMRKNQWIKNGDMKIHV